MGPNLQTCQVGCSSAMPIDPLLTASGSVSGGKSLDPVANRWNPLGHGTLCPPEYLTSLEYKLLLCRVYGARIKLQFPKLWTLRQVISYPRIYLNIELPLDFPCESGENIHKRML